MKTAISVPGTFHAFKIGEELEKREALTRIYTTYPWNSINTTLPRKKVVSFVFPEMIHQIGSKSSFLNRVVSYFSGWDSPFERWKGDLFDFRVARRIQKEDIDLLLGFAGVSLRTLRKANELDVTTALERSSSHIRVQAEILEEEYRTHGIESSPISNRHIGKEEHEYEEADYVIVPSDFVYKSFIQQGYPDEKLILEPFGVNTSRFVPDEEKRSGALKFVFAGGPSLRKGTPYLLDAWTQASVGDSELYLLGEISDEVRPLVDRYKKEPSVQFKGWVDDIAEWYQRASVFVFPSLEEGSAMVTYEAMASGLPLITTFNSGWVGEDGKHGVEVPARDSASIADAIERLYTNPKERRSMGKAARQLIEDRHTIEAYGERIYNQYLSLVG